MAVSSRRTPAAAVQARIVAPAPTSARRRIRPTCSAWPRRARDAGSGSLDYVGATAEGRGRLLTPLRSVTPVNATANCSSGRAREWYCARVDTPIDPIEPFPKHEVIHGLQCNWYPTDAAIAATTARRGNVVAFSRRSSRATAAENPVPPHDARMAPAEQATPPEE